MAPSGMFVLVAAYMAGVLLSSVYLPDVGLCVFLLLTMCLPKVVSLIFSCREGEKKFDKKFLSTRAVLVWIFCFGILLGLARVSLWSLLHHPGALHALDGQKVTLEGIVVEEPSTTETLQKIILEADLVKHGELVDKIQNERVLITANRYETILYGDRLKILGTLKIPKPIEQNNETFAYDVYLARQGIFSTMSFTQITVLEHGQGNRVQMFLYSVKHAFMQKAIEILPSPHSGLFLGLVVSGRSGLGTELQETFTRAGIVHIVALSGANVTIIVESLMVGLFFLTKRLRLFVGALGIISFTIMTGAEPTVIRAAIMALLVIGASVFHRTADVKRGLFIAAGAMSFWDPMIVFNMSFGLSFWATFALVCVVPVFEKRYDWLVSRISEKLGLRQIIVSSIVIEIWLLPLLLYSIGSVSVVGIISNILILPIVPVAMLLGFIATIVGGMSWWVALPITAGAYLSLEYILVIARWVSLVPFALVEIKISGWVMVSMYAALGAWYWYMNFDKQKPPQQ